MKVELDAAILHFAELSMKCQVRFFLRVLNLLLHSPFDRKYMAAGGRGFAFVLKLLKLLRRIFKPQAKVTQSLILQSSQMYLPLMSVLGGRSAAKIEDRAPSSMESGPCECVV